MELFDLRYLLPSLLVGGEKNSYLLDDDNILYFLLHKGPCVARALLRSRGELKIKDMKVIQYVILHDCRFLCPKKPKKGEYKNQNQFHPK